MKRRSFRTAAVALFGLFVVGALQAQARTDFPSRPVTLMVPFPAGGPTDVLARVLADALAQNWGQPVVVKNRPGAGTVVGTNAVAKSEADGYTLGVVITAHVINPAVRSDMPFDTRKDLIGVTQLTQAPVVLVAHPALEADTMAKLLALAKSSPAPLHYASPGLGTATHMAGELLQQKVGIKLRHVPYNGSGPALIDVLAGRVPLMFDIWHSVKAHVEAGKLKVLGVAGKEKIPGEPYATIGETVPGYEIASIFGIVAPAGLSKETLEKIAADIVGVVKSPQFVERVRGLGMEPVGSRPAEFDTLIKNEIDKWDAIAKQNNIKVE